MSWSQAWNWKSAVLSSICRAAIFFAINLAAGLEAALTAMQVEFVHRAVAAGFYGSLTEYFSRLPNERMARRAATVAVPGVAHLIELGVHSWAGTPFLGWSLVGSVAFSIVTTRLSLFAMRRGVLITGEGQQSWRHDLQAVPGLVTAFLAPHTRSLLR